MAEQRRLILSKVRGEILEIGIGTGVNLLYYPEHVRNITTIEPSDAMRPRARKRESKTDRIIEWLQGRGEDMPFDEGRFDAVLGEAYRVLKKGGRLHFLEHGISKEEKIRKRQTRLNGLSKVIACGCQLTRDIEAHIRKSDFVIDELVDVQAVSGMNGVYTHSRPCS